MLGRFGGPAIHGAIHGATFLHLFFPALVTALKTSTARSASTHGAGT